VAGHVRCLCLSNGNIEFFEILQLTFELEKAHFTGASTNPKDRLNLHQRVATECR
jgi:hypothetical protein